jgi:hypothetical protein
LPGGLGGYLGGYSGQHPSFVGQLKGSCNVDEDSNCRAAKKKQKRGERKKEVRKRKKCHGLSI